MLYFILGIITGLFVATLQIVLDNRNRPIKLLENKIAQKAVILGNEPKDIPFAEILSSDDIEAKLKANGIIGVDDTFYSDPEKDYGI